MTGMKWGIYIGIGLKCLDTFITLLFADVFTAILFLVAVGVVFIPKIGFVISMAIAFAIYQFTDINLFFVLIAAALTGTILGALPGMAVGGAIGLARRNSIPVATDATPESDSIAITAFVLPLIGAGALFAFYFLVVNPWLISVVD